MSSFLYNSGTLKNLARETTRKHAENEAGFDLGRVRLLLEFVEQLEKSIYNASDGTAAALLAAPKVNYVLALAVLVHGYL